MKKTIYCLSVILCELLLAGVSGHAQQLKLGNNPTVIDKTALLELESNNQGLLLPRISDTNAFHPNPIPNGMLIYYVGTSDSCLMIRKDGRWVKIVDFVNLDGQETDPTAWKLTGNAGTTPNTNFLGTTDNNDLVFKTNNNERMRITAGGNVGIGTNSPLVALHTNGQAAFGSSITTTRLQSGTPGNLGRTFSLIDPTAVMRVWRFTNNTGQNPAVELIWGNTDDVTNTANKWWDFYVLASDAFSIRRRTGNANQDMLTITYNGTNGNVGINNTTPQANIDVNGNFKLGQQGTTNKNIISFSYTAGTVNFSAGTGNKIVLGGTVQFSANTTQLNIPIPGGSQPTTTQAAVMVSPNQPLPNPVSIAYAYLTSTSNVRVVFVNASTSSQSVSNLTLYITIFEF